VEVYIPASAWSLFHVAPGVPLFAEAMNVILCLPMTSAAGVVPAGEPTVIKTDAVG